MTKEFVITIRIPIPVSIGVAHEKLALATIKKMLPMPKALPKDSTMEYEIREVEKN